MLVVLEKLGDQLAGGAEVDPVFLKRVLAYFSDFLIQVHQVKESDYLFPAAAMMDFARAGECIGRLVADHDETGVLLASLGEMCHTGSLGVEERKAVTNLIRTYCKRLTRHMEEEEEVFVLLGEFLSEKDEAKMIGQFEVVDRGHPSVGEWEREVKHLESLIE
jgi:hemerythrin-like domain-containing protein